MKINDVYDVENQWVHLHIIIYVIAAGGYIIKNKEM